ncbi:hypothetical protein H4Q32_030226 [Labeo rohita]|uniref:Endonuclease/exonuclease/phosphatase domain-containing protein n=1 Tax=Labeo rohita TaxID=84645 RepID=A0ABQ8LAB9_LABRO|nr:hypothetical protein H4Q32_030226 [Labeo rohita]
MLDDIKNKSVIVCGDFNIDLGNTVAINDFKNYMGIAGLCPMITKPTRITTHSATIIDNIYTNLHGDIINGIFMIDVSDHLPVFTIYDNFCINTMQDNSFVIIRDKSSKAIEDFREDLKRQNWDQVYTNDLNNAYNAFMTTLINLYDKNCKQIKICAQTAKISFDKPWMTNGLKNACKKKNYLYRMFLKKRTEDAECRYKKYKNKLVSIIRKQKKDYYTNLIDKNKGSIKNMWGVIDTVLHKGKAKIITPDFITK